jgi:hypothetical protein
MAPRSAAELMDLWDVLASCAPGGRADVLAQHCLGAGQPRQAAGPSLGACQAAVLESLAAAFGAHITCLDDCPDCGARVTARLSVDELLTAQQAAPPCRGRITQDDWQVDYRLPTAADLAEASRAENRATAAERLQAATILGLRRGGKAARREDLPAAVLTALARHIETEDPLAAAELALTCPDCGRDWVSGLDAARLFLARLDAWAKRTLWEVHQLAMRYGWREGDILALSPQRREAYLMMDAP